MTHVHDSPALGDLTSFIEATLGPPTDWITPTGYPDGLALCLIDAIWSLGANYQRHVVFVLDRYRQLRREAGHDPTIDRPTQLLEAISSLGGPEGFAAAVKNHQRTSPRGGVLKAEAAAEAATLFADRDIESPGALLRAVAEDPGELRVAWQQIPGQRSSTTGWRYLLILAGGQDVKPDRMICRYVADATGQDKVQPEEAAALLEVAARNLGADLRTLDHAVWRYQAARVRPRDRH